MSSREKILANIRRHSVAGPELPDQSGPWIVYPDPRQQFIDVLHSVGGQVHVVGSEADLAAQITSLGVYQEAKQRASTLSLGGDWNVDIAQLEDPHQLAAVDFAVLRGQFAVAENGAIWITDEGLRHRAIFFIVQHLAIVVPGDQIVHHMHEAYTRLTWERQGFGCFLCGPSKTADIEQSLVIGAHGSRSLHVFLT